MSKKQLFLAVFSMMALLVSHYSCVKDQGKLPGAVSQSLCDSMNVKYSTVIQPMMVTYCAMSNCHDAIGSAPGNLNMYADLKAMIDNQQFKSRVFTIKDMPQAPNLPLADSLLQKIQCWLAAGALND